jgi:hypothetical protein
MSIAFQTARIEFDKSSGDTQQGRATVIFGQPVNSAEAAIRGFEIGYSDDDHEIFKEQIEIKRVRVENRTGVEVEVDFLLRDSSGRIDDAFEGWVDVLVIADLKESDGGGDRAS